MKFLKSLTVIVSCIVLSGCSQPAVYTKPKIESTAYSEKVIKVDQPLDLELVCDYGNIEMYSWDKPEVKFEMKKRVRGTQERAQLDEKLRDFKIDTKQAGAKVTFTAEYTGSIKSSEDKLLDLRVYIPRQVKGISQKMEKGYIKFQDDLRCLLNIEAKTAQVDINRIDGAVKLNVGTGNVKIGSGRIKADSEIVVNLGNIYAKCQYDNKVKCRYETNTGNVELFLPSDFQNGIDYMGTLDVNEFPAMKRDKDLTVKSGVGNISLRKF